MRDGSTACRVVGLGSAHGDDRMGWMVAEALGPRLRDLGVMTTVAVTPLDLLELAGAGVLLVVIDTCRGGGQVGQVRLVDPTELEIRGEGAATSHGYGVAEVLRLAEALGRLPAGLVLVAIEAGGNEAGLELGAALAERFPAVVDEVEVVVRRIVEAARAGDESRLAPRGQGLGPVFGKVVAS